MSSRFTYLVECGKIFLFVKTEQYSLAHIEDVFFIHSSSDGHVSCFHLLATMNKVARSINVLILLQFLSVLLDIYTQK